MSPMMVQAIGWIAPAPSPWTARKAMSGTMPQAKPQAVDPTRNSAAPAKNRRFLP